MESKKLQTLLILSQVPLKFIENNFVITSYQSWKHVLQVSQPKNQLMTLPDLVSNICPEASNEEAKKFLEEVVNITFYRGNKWEQLVLLLKLGLKNSLIIFWLELTLQVLELYFLQFLFYLLRGKPVWIKQKICVMTIWDFHKTEKLPIYFFFGLRSH